MNWSRWLPWLAILSASLHLSSLARVPGPKPGTMDIEAFARLPVQDGGRIKPIDTVARVALTIINSRQKCIDNDDKVIPPVRWYLRWLVWSRGPRGRRTRHTSIAPAL